MTYLPSRAKALLAFLDAPSGPFPAHQHRISAGMFQMTKDPAWSGQQDFYQFTHEDHGPFSPEIHRDLARLRIAGFVREMKVSRDSVRKLYVLTDLGKAEADRFMSEISEREQEALRSGKLRATSHDYRALIY